jgi:methylation protein EvaC
MSIPSETPQCAFCQSKNLSDVINFGDFALAGGFLKKEQIPTEKKYPLVIVFCRDCYAVQVRDHIDPEVLFKTDFYFSSAIKTLRDHFTAYATEVVDRFLPDPKQAKVLEFGSNDGVLLKPLADQGVGTVIGVDPAQNIVEGIDDGRLKLVNDFFNAATADRITQEYGNVDMVMANNVFAHITDINGVTEGVYNVLGDEGVFVFEVHYLGKILEEMQYDFIYHEHIYYYSMLALENHLARHNMVIFDIKPISIHGGSIRYYAAKKDSQHAGAISDAVIELRKQELALGYDKAETYAQFASRVAEKKEALMSLLTDLKQQGNKIVGYGASGRANTIIQYCGITDEYVDYMIDDGPAKQGLYTPGSHLEIKDNSMLTTDKPDYAVLFAWAFYEEIAKKSGAYLEAGGKFIVPLPEVRVIGVDGKVLDIS